MPWGFPDSASSLRALSSTSAHQPRHQGFTHDHRLHLGSVVGLPSARTSGPSAAPHPSSPWAPSGFSFPPALPLSSLTLSSPQFSSTLALPRPLIITSPSWSPGPSMMPGLLVHHTTPGPPQLPLSPLLVGLKFPPSAPPCVLPPVLPSLSFMKLQTDKGQTDL